MSTRWVGGKMSAYRCTSSRTRQTASIGAATVTECSSWYMGLPLRTGLDWTGRDGSTGSGDRRQRIELAERIELLVVGVRRLEVQTLLPVGDEVEDRGQLRELIQGLEVLAGELDDRVCGHSPGALVGAQPQVRLQVEALGEAGADDEFAHGGEEGLLLVGGNRLRETVDQGVHDHRWILSVTPGLVTRLGDDLIVGVSARTSLESRWNGSEQDTSPRHGYISTGRDGSAPVSY